MNNRIHVFSSALLMFMSNPLMYFFTNCISVAA